MKKNALSQRTIPWRQWRRTHLVQNHDEMQRGLGGSWQKGYQQVAGVSTHRFDKAAMKKAKAIASKTHFLSKAALSRCTQNNSHKNKGFLVSPIKVYISASQRSRSITKCRAIALTCRIGAAGCRRIGGTMVALFCCFLACGEKREDVGIRQAVGLWACN